MKRQNLFAIACATATAAATVMGNAGSASATALYGQFHFSNENFNPATSISLSSSGITFSNPALINILGPSTTDTFTGFSGASILSGASLLTAGSSIDIANLLDLGSISGSGEGSLSDSINTFTLTDSYAFEYTQFGPPMFATTSISVGVNGFFTGNGGEQTMGSGIFTFQVLGKTIAEVQQTLTSGGSFSNLTFSGGFIARPVPEPTALAGLGLVAGIFAVSRRRKADNN